MRLSSGTWRVATDGVYCPRSAKQLDAKGGFHRPVFYIPRWPRTLCTTTLRLRQLSPSLFAPSSFSLIRVGVSFVFAMSLLLRLPRCGITDGDFIPDPDTNNSVHVSLVHIYWRLPTRIKLRRNDGLPQFRAVMWRRHRGERS